MAGLRPPVHESDPLITNQQRPLEAATAQAFATTGHRLVTGGNGQTELHAAVSGSAEGLRPHHHVRGAGEPATESPAQVPGGVAQGIGEELASAAG